MADFITSDTHAFHENIIRYSARPFATTLEMTEALASNINSIVGAHDRLFHLGDWSFAGRANVKIFREMINCHNVILILGNHDHHIRNHPEERKLFSRVEKYYETRFNGHTCTMCHFAGRSWEKRHYGAWNFYGDAHGSLPDDPNALAIDVGVDTEWPNIHEKYFPYTMDEILQIMATKTWVQIDHHNRETNP